MSGASRWSCLLAENSPIRHWDGEFLVFNPANASTHLIGAPAFEVLQTLRQTPAPLSLAELAERLLGAEAVEDEAFLAELGACLQQFEDLGLAETLSA